MGDGVLEMGEEIRGNRDGGRVEGIERRQYKEAANNANTTYREREIRLI